MDLIKHLEFFNPIALEHPIHIIGCGAIGSNLAEQLTRLGCTQIHLYDFDIVDEYNIANQSFVYQDIGQPKTNCVGRMMRSINPEVVYVTHDKGYTDEPLSGYVFLCVDNIELRRAIVEANMYNPYILAMFDFRMRLSDAQHYAADWTNEKQRNRLLASMQFSEAEAKEGTPVSACGTTLSVLSTVRMITAMGISNFINFVKKEPIRPMLLVDAFAFNILSV